MKLELNIEKLLLIIFAGAFLIQLTYFLAFFIRMVLKQKPVAIEKLKPASIIIAARNEEQNLIEFLPKILEQNYPEFEIIQEKSKFAINEKLLVKEKYDSPYIEKDLYILENNNKKIYNKFNLKNIFS
mgnify:CR=1 FL=1